MFVTKPKYPEKFHISKKMCDIKQKVTSIYTLLSKPGFENKEEILTILQTIEPCINEVYGLLGKPFPTPTIQVKEIVVKTTTKSKKETLTWHL